jgi:integrase
MPVNEVGVDAVLSVLRPLWTRAPETASRLRGRIETVIAAAQALGHIDRDRANPARWKHHLDKLLPKRQRLTRGHHKALPYEEVPALVKLLRASKATAALALEYAILTGTRSGETIKAVWSELDVDRATWVIPAERMLKIDEEFRVPLSDRAVAILAEARRRHRKAPRPDSYVFAGARPNEPLSDMAFAMLLRRMKVDATAHGFRSSFRNWCSDVAHVPFEVAEACLSHRVGSAVSRACLRTDSLERRRRSWRSGRGTSKARPRPVVSIARKRRQS